MAKVRRSRRAAGLQPGDYDHEITLIDGEENQSPRPMSSDGGGNVTANTSTRLLSDDDGEEEEEQQQQQQQHKQKHDASKHQEEDGLSKAGSKAPEDRDNGHKCPQLQLINTQDQLHPPESSTRPSIEIQAPSPGPLPAHSENGQTHRIIPKRQRERREAVIDILYENERGGFLCGIAWFSSAALGFLDPTGWSNAYHNPSPTDIHTAQVPDPSWEWVWPEWRLNHEEGDDADGWEYSFAFSKKFSWHGPKWWSSFVRRRAWIRRRAKKRPEDISADPHMLNTDYFTVHPTSVRSRQSPGSLACSRVPSKASLTQTSTAEAEEPPRPDIEDMEMLLQVLRSARIDREKREAVENYLEHAIDLTELQHEMHEIMSLFVFQASRRQLLGHLMQKHEETIQAFEADKTLELKVRKKALDAAVRHAEEEVCRLAYWSDVKQMAESGELRDVLNADEGWHDAWQGLDRSAPSAPRPPGNSSKSPERCKVSI